MKCCFVVRVDKLIRVATQDAVKNIVFLRHKIKAVTHEVATCKLGKVLVVASR